MAKSATLLSIITDLKAIQRLAPSDLTKGDDFGLPRLIPAGDCGAIQINKVIDDNISLLARELKSEQPKLAKNVRNEEWRSWLRSTIGPALMQVDLSDQLDLSSDKVLLRLKQEIDALVAGLGPSECAFGTTFLDIPNLPPFTVGPVKFERREDWLNRKHADGSITPTISNRITRMWSGASLRPRKKAIDNMRERDIIDAIGNNRVVCSVSVDGLSGEAGREIALSTARISLAIISLLWEQSSKALSGMNLHVDGGLRRERILRFLPGRVTLQGSRLHGRPHGPSLSVREWGQLTAANSDFFRVASEILFYLISPEGAVSRPKLMNALMQSLLWFYEGCREENDLLGVVDFAASLDALGGGKKTKAIMQMLKARLGAQESASVYQGGPTLKSLVEAIYSDGRSRAIHGTSDKIGHDWARTRRHAESLARLALYASLEWAGANINVDDPELLKK